MLINFKIKNFKSIKEMQTFSMVAGRTQRKSERILKKRNFNLLKFSAIYGSNAAGKSNLVQGLSSMQYIVLKGVPDKPALHSFKLDEKSFKSDTYFEVEISIDDNFYAYGFEINYYNNVITSEWLVLLNNGTEKQIFARQKDSIDIDMLYFAPDTRKKLEVYIDDVKKDNTILFLTYLNRNKEGFYFDDFGNSYSDTHIFRSIYLWFLEYLVIAGPKTTITSPRFIFIKEGLDLLKNLLKSFDTGIHDIKIEDGDKEIRELLTPQSIEKIRTDFINKKNRDVPIQSLTGYIKLEQVFFIATWVEDNLKFQKLSFYHENNDCIPFSLSEESHGTARLLDLGETLITDERNKTFVIDELDRCLHPQVTIGFVDLFLKKASDNEFNNQLIVTTHESRLLDFEIIRRDEVWFVDKKNGETSLYSLEEFSDRFDRKIDKAYLDGRYGGIPIFKTNFHVLKGDNNNESVAK